MFEVAFAGLQERLTTAFVAGRPLDEEIEYVRLDGHPFLGPPAGHTGAWDQPAGEQLWIVEDVTAARAQRMQPTWVAKHDALTELANRREFERRLSDHVGSRRHEPVCMLWLDVDKFTEVVHGMGAGWPTIPLWPGADAGDQRCGPLIWSRAWKTTISPSCCRTATSITRKSSLKRSARRWRPTGCAGACTARGSKARMSASCNCWNSLETVDAVLGAGALACAEATGRRRLRARCSCRPAVSRNWPAEPGAAGRQFLRQDPQKWFFSPGLKFGFG